MQREQGRHPSTHSSLRANNLRPTKEKSLVMVPDIPKILSIIGSSGSLGLWVDLLKVPPISLQLSLGWGRHSLWSVNTRPRQLWKASEACWSRQFPLRGTPCVHNRSSFPPIGFCSSSFLWYRMHSTLRHCYLSQVCYSTQARPAPAAVTPNPPTLVYVRHHLSGINTKSQSGFSIFGTQTHVHAHTCARVHVYLCIHASVAWSVVVISDFLTGSFSYASFP